jgi:hypothetical protein
MTRYIDPRSGIGRPILDPDPRHAEGGWDEGFEEGYTAGQRDAMPPMLAFLIVSIISAIVAGALVWSWWMATAPRSAATVIPTAGPALAVAESKGTTPASWNLSLPSRAPLVSRPDAGIALAAPAAVPVPPSSEPTQDPGERSSSIASGIAAYAVPSYGSRYLAIPEGPGVRVTVCSQATPLRCVDRVSTDAGPDREMQRAGRVADVSYVDFAYLCGCDPRIRGTMPVTIHYGAAAGATPPSTDVQP